MMACSDLCCSHTLEVNVIRKATRALEQLQQLVAEAFRHRGRVKTHKRHGPRTFWRQQLKESHTVFADFVGTTQGQTRRHPVELTTNWIGPRAQTEHNRDSETRRTRVSTKPLAQPSPSQCTILCRVFTHDHTSGSVSCKHCVQHFRPLILGASVTTSTATSAAVLFLVPARMSSITKAALRSADIPTSCDIVSTFLRSNWKSPRLRCCPSYAPSRLMLWRLVMFASAFQKSAQLRDHVKFFTEM